MSDDLYGLRSVDIEQLRNSSGAKWSAFDADYASWVADMDFPVAPPVKQAIDTIVEHNEFGYPGWLTEPKTPAAKLFVDRMSTRYGWQPDLERVFDLNDVLQGVLIAFQHLTDPGDAFVIHMPAYDPFLAISKGMKRPIVPVPAELTDNGWAFDYDRLEQQLAETPARLWMLCHPQNPLGHVFDRAELERIAEIAIRHDLIVISDEIHADIRYVDIPHIPFASVSDEVAQRTVTITSASKAFNLAGLRWAAMHVGYQPLVDAISAIPVHYFGAPNSIAMAATVAAWTEGDPWLQAVIEVLDENRNALAVLLDKYLPGAVYRPPSATYLAWVDLSATGLGDDPHATIRERRVEFASGDKYGSVGTGHVRINLATSPDILAAAVATAAGEA